jgi:hypothetical protein
LQDDLPSFPSLELGRKGRRNRSYRLVGGKEWSLASLFLAAARPSRRATMLAAAPGRDHCLKVEGKEKAPWLINREPRPPCEGACARAELSGTEPRARVEHSEKTRSCGDERRSVKQNFPSLVRFQKLLGRGSRGSCLPYWWSFSLGQKGAKKARSSGRQSLRTRAAKDGWEGTEMEPK